MTEVVLASSSFAADTQASKMQGTAAHKAGMFQANAVKKSEDSNDSSQECQEYNAFEEPADIADTFEETDDSPDASKKSGGKTVACDMYLVPFAFVELRARPFPLKVCNLNLHEEQSYWNLQKVLTPQ